MGKEPVLAGSGWVGKKDVVSPVRIAAALLDELSEQLVSGCDPLARLRGFFLETSDPSRTTTEGPVSLSSGRAGQRAFFQQHTGTVEGEAAFLGMQHASDVIGERLITGEGE